MTSRLQTYVFVGSLTDGHNTDSYSFRVLAGAGGATLTGGGSKWGTVDRPQRKGLTILQGYDPLTLVVPIIFDAVTLDRDDRLAGHPNTAGKSLEDDIQKLLWMWGRGLLYNTGVGGSAQGDSPLVQVLTADDRGAPTPLVPKDLQTANLFWVIGDLGFDTNPMRNRAGYRIRQAVTVTLTEHVSSEFASSADSPRRRQQGRGALAGKYLTVRATSELNTIAKLAWHYAHTNSFQDSLAIITANPGLHLNRSVKAAQKKLKHGTKVRIPMAIVKHISHT